MSAKRTKKAKPAVVILAARERLRKERSRERNRLGRSKHDWRKYNSTTDAQALAGALADPDAQPIRPGDEKRMTRVARVKVIRQALGMSQREFADSFSIPLGTLRDWEQGRAQPDQAARAYLRVIALRPDVVQKALEPA